jgi:acid phosphatase
VRSCSYTPNTPSINLLNDLRAKGVYVAIISAGSASNQPYSEACLRQNGVQGWSSIRYRTDAEGGTAFAVYKARARSAVEKQGYRIIASIGDQVSDMSWGHTERGFLLPNLMSYLN